MHVSVERWMGKVWYSHRIHYSENELTTIIYTHTQNMDSFHKYKVEWKKEIIEYMQFDFTYMKYRNQQN